ncbi:MAG: hypothetical protein A2137_03370, partial [Chloroflexi bacterium RBG_16_58_8]
QVMIPNTYVTYGRRENGGDFLFLHLLEPHALGEEYVDSVAELLLRFHARRYCLLGSMYDFVPHTRPLLVTGGSETPAIRLELERLGVSQSDYEGPTTICHLITQKLAEHGVESMTMLVRLPQYTQLEEDYMGIVRLEEIIASLCGIEVDDQHLEKAAWQRQHVTSLVAKNPQMQEILDELESSYDAGIKEKKAAEDSRPLSPEVEEFLKEMERKFRRE